MTEPLQPQQVWWTVQEIASANLADLPATVRGVQRQIDRHNWRAAPNCARRRKGKGGGWEYHWTLFPTRAQQALLATATTVAPAPEREDAWQDFEQLSDRARAAARKRLEVIQRVEALLMGGMIKNTAVNQMARTHGVSAKTIWNWFSLIDGVRIEDRLVYLAPRHGTSDRKLKEADYSDEFRDYIFSDYLRPEAPSFAAVYRRAVRIAKAEGWTTAPERRMRRHLEAEFSQLTITLCRKGVDALKRLYPAQTRDRLSLHAMEAVNADYHRFDVFVRWPAEPGSNSGEGEVVRPQLVAFQDIYSGRILSWRIDRTPNKLGVSLALGDMIERFGIPEHIVLDNGREFANKFLTGGTPTRFRFKVKEDDIPGILTTLGVKVHWATPYSGQSKPIERAFRDFCDDISKDPRFAGAYTGNRPDAKPENYQSAAIPLERFIEVIAEGIEEHNARAGRRGQTTMGRSILETFEQSYVQAPIRKATEQQRRLWLMGAEGLRPNARTAQIRFMGNGYFSEWMHDIAGQKVVARFDPADLRAGLHLYSLGGKYLGHAECRVAAGFFDIEEARNHNKARSDLIKAEKIAAEKARRFSAAELGTFLDRAAAENPPAAPDVAAKVVKLAGPLPRVPRPQPKAAELSPDERAEREAFVADFGAAKAAADARAPKDDARVRFAQAMEMEARLADGEPLTRDQERWLEGYRQTPEYAAHKAVMDDLGKGFSG